MILYIGIETNFVINHGVLLWIAFDEGMTYNK
ncbi:hypothetical protein CLSC106687_17110 [[Clostridium] scindens]|uniref:Uncharacterized protein n=1 Tax=Clostridium scindens (strain ATCC 35704 / DSM 5676 / VPI 13733 / 19) TaxID=411468 RepID=A0A494WTD5_CLOS5|nr:hypothetical protein HDCHBGLK_03625 [[Clostridium] scindens ATCC 35704]